MSAERELKVEYIMIDRREIIVALRLLATHLPLAQYIDKQIGFETAV